VSLQNFFVRAVSVLRTPAIKDRYSNDSRDWSNPITVGSTNGWLAPVTSQKEDNKDREQAEAMTWLYLPSGTDILPTDRCTVDGIQYQVLSFPADCWTPNGSHHLEVRVERIDG
jgi:hypothetical protein